MPGEKTAEDDFILFPSLSGGGVLIRRSQIIGARPNGVDGAIAYSAAGPAIYTSYSTVELARFLGAEIADKR
jgi:hypothetical protein